MYNVLLSFHFIFYCLLNKDICRFSYRRVYLFSPIEDMLLAFTNRIHFKLRDKVHRRHFQMTTLWQYLYSKSFNWRDQTKIRGKQSAHYILSNPFTCRIAPDMPVGQSISEKEERRKTIHRPINLSSPIGFKKGTCFSFSQNSFFTWGEKITPLSF